MITVWDDYCHWCKKPLGDDDPYTSVPEGFVIVGGDEDTYVYFHPGCYLEWLEAPEDNG